MPEISLIVGGAGTGKTTELLRVMQKVIEAGIHPLDIGFVSFTRAARAEAAERASKLFDMTLDELERDGFFRTLHSVCYRQLGIAADQLLTDSKKSCEWLQEALQESVSGGPDADGGKSDHSEILRGKTDADYALALWSCARNRLEPLDKVWVRAEYCDERTPPLEFCRRLVESYELNKRLDQRVDFTDLLGAFSGWRFGLDGHDQVEPRGGVPDVPVWFLDECQDNSALTDAVARRLVAPAKWVYLVGDPFQCQPTGTPVLTADGYKPIEDLDPETDKLIAFNQRDGRFYGMSKRLKFCRASRTVDSGSMVEITLEDGTTHLSTMNHQWLCRRRRSDQFAVYLMRKGDRWRVGTVQMFGNGEYTRKNGDFRLNMRSNQEGADASWILAMFSTDRAARAYEQIVSCRYGLPQVTFRPPGGGPTNLDAEFIETVFAALPNLTIKGVQCLADHGRHFEFPFWKRGRAAKTSSRVSRRLHACNLIPEIMFLPKLNRAAWTDGRTSKQRGVHRDEEMRQRRLLRERVEWVKIVGVRRIEPGTPVVVHSLEVEKHHTYVTKEFVTGNCIYGWAGAQSNHFLDWPVPESRKRILQQTYRCPAPVLSLGESILRECSDYWDRGLMPAPHAGEVTQRWYQEPWPEEVDPRESWLLIARTNFQASRLIKRMVANGIPWVPTNGIGGKWNAPQKGLAIQGLLELSRGGVISVRAWRAALKYLPAKELLTKGTKSKWESYAGPDPDFRDLAGITEWGATELLCTRIRNGTWRQLVDGADDFCAAVARWGVDAVFEPKVRVGTVHSVKGQEADNVLLFTTTSHQVQKGQDDRDGANEERRVEYVGVTRARKRLVICGEAKAAFSMGLPG